MLYFWKAWVSRISNMTFPRIKCKIHKYTNSQIHKYTNTKCLYKTQHVLYFWKAGGSRISIMIIISSYHYAYHHKYKVFKRPNMCYIFEKLVVQRYQLWSLYHINLTEHTVVLMDAIFEDYITVVGSFFLKIAAVENKIFLQ